MRSSATEAPPAGLEHIGEAALGLGAQGERSAGKQRGSATIAAQVAGGQ
ncbi:MAG TPA: hypothetical protein VGH93_00485 [Solirubrobacteraceae bacterium]